MALDTRGSRVMRSPCLTPASLSTTLAHPIAILCWAPAAWLALTALACDQAPIADDRAISAGRWNIVSVEWDGKPVDPEFLALLHVMYAADGSWAVMFRSVPVAEGTSSNHQEQSPRTFEMETLGSEGIKPRRYWGIYRLEGDTRVLCIAAAAKPRPDRFMAPKRSGWMLVTLKRAKAP